MSRLFNPTSIKLPSSLPIFPSSSLSSKSRLFFSSNFAALSAFSISKPLRSPPPPFVRCTMTESAATAAVDAGMDASCSKTTDSAVRLDVFYQFLNLTSESIDIIGSSYFEE